MSAAVLFLTPFRAFVFTIDMLFINSQTCSHGPSLANRTWWEKSWYVHVNVYGMQAFGRKRVTALSLGIRSLFGPTQKSSPWDQFFRRWIKSFNQAWTFIVNLWVDWLIDDKLTLTWLGLLGSCWTIGFNGGGGWKWPNTAGQYSRRECRCRFMLPHWIWQRETTYVMSETGLA